MRVVQFLRATLGHFWRALKIFTTNKPLNQWVQYEDLAHAIVDRVLERGRFLTLDGPSMRTKHLGIDDPTSDGSQTVVPQPARISGIQAPEFPEPTVPMCQNQRGTG